MSRRSFRLTAEQQRKVQEELRRRGLATDASAIRPREDAAERPLSAAQHRIWFLEQMEPDGATYNMPALIRLGGALDVAALEWSLGEVVRRHEALRTVFPSADGEPLQEVLPYAPLTLPVADFAGLPAGLREGAARALAFAEGRRPFDLAAGPLFRVALLRLGAADHLLLFVMHHLVADGWSTMILNREMGRLYGAVTGGGEPVLPELPIQYADFTAWQRRWLEEGEAVAAQLAYWRRQLAEAADPLELPVDWPASSGRVSRAASVRGEIATDLAPALETLGQRLGATFFMTLLAAFEAQLHLYTGQTPLSVGTPVAGRHRPEVRDLIGLFINTLALRTQLAPETTFRQLLAQTRSAVLDAYAHQDVPFERLVRELRPERQLDRNPFFQVLFALGGATRLELPGLAVEPEELEVGRARFALSLTVNQTSAGLLAILVYDAALFRASTARRMLEHFQAILGQIVRDPDRPVADLDPLTPAERHQVLVEWSDTARLEIAAVPSPLGEDPVFAFVEEPEPAPVPGFLVSLPGSAWALWRPVFLRGAGFPAEGVLRLASPSCAAAADRLLDLETASGRDGGELAAARVEMAEIYDREVFRLRQEIERLAADGRFREAVTWQNRHAVETAFDTLLRHPAEPGRRPSQRRKHEELVALYLQRYCVKNDTIGFFGPLGYAEWAEEGAVVQVRPGADLVGRREVFFENWCIDALAQSLSADLSLRRWLAPRLKSSFHLEGDVLHPPFGEPARLAPLEQRALVLCDGRRTARELARELAAEGEGGEDEVYACLEELCRRRILSWGLEVPLELHPDRALEDQLLRIEPAALRAPALDALAELRAGRRKVAESAGDAAALREALQGLDESFARLTGGPARHHEGRMYAARGLVYEDCRRDLEARFGPGLISRLGVPLGVVLTAARWLAGEITRRAEARLLEVHSELRRRTGRDAVDGYGFYTQGLSALFLKRERDACFGEAERAYQRRWREVLGIDGTAERRLRFASGELARRFEAAFGRPEPAWSLARYFSPDVLIAARDEEALRRDDYEVILGEVHAGNTLLSSCFVALHPEPADLERILADDAGEGTWVLPQLPRQKWPQRLALGLSLPRFHQFQFADEPPGGPRAHALPAGGTVIESTAAGLRGRSRDGRVEFPAIDLFSNYLNHQCSAIVSSLLPKEAHSPRVTLDAMVVSRERWCLNVAELGVAELQDRRERFLEVRRWAHAAGLPRFCFYKLTTEDKPCFLDFDSPIYVDLFMRLVRVARAASGGASLAITEMLPRIDQAWLMDASGNRYTSELRLVARALDFAAMAGGSRG